MGFGRACGLARAGRSFGAGAPRAVRASRLELAGGLPERRSLSGRKQFRRVLGEGRRARGRLVTVHACPSEGGRDHARLGLVVPGRGVSAISRNRMKRRLRAAFAATAAPPGFDFVVRARPDVEHVDFQLLVDELRHGVEVTAG
jgi:ribonuclease P protein component